MHWLSLTKRVIRVSHSLGTPFTHEEDETCSSSSALPFPLPLSKCTPILCVCIAVYPTEKFLQCPLSLLGTKYKKSSGGDCQALLNACGEEVPTTLCHWLGYTIDITYSL